jgi:hypothetical protein
MNSMSIMGKEGHTSCNWDPNDPASVALAQTTFTELTAQGYRGARMDNPSEGDFITEFDPSAGHILMVPPMRGG